MKRQGSPVFRSLRLAARLLLVLFGLFYLAQAAPTAAKTAAAKPVLMSKDYSFSS